MSRRVSPTLLQEAFKFWKGLAPEIQCLDTERPAAR
jgi:hypothetical protein